MSEYDESGAEFDVDDGASEVPGAWELDEDGTYLPAAPVTERSLEAERQRLIDEAVAWYRPAPAAAVAVKEVVPLDEVAVDASTVRNPRGRHVRLVDRETKPGPPASVRRLFADGREEEMDGLPLAELASHLGWTIEDLVAPTPRGHLSTGERSRRDDLAKVVVLARGRGVKIDALAQALSRPLSTITALETRGRELGQTEIP